MGSRRAADTRPMVWAPVRRRHARSFPGRASARGARRAAAPALRRRGDVLRPRGGTGRTHARGRGETRTPRCRVLPRRAQQPVGVADEPAVQAVEQLVALLLVQLEMAGRVERDGADTSAIASDPQCDLLRHCAGRHEHRGLLAEQLGDLLLETLDALAGAVHVHPLVLARLIGERREAVAPGWAAAPSVEEALGTLDGG